MVTIEAYDKEGKVINGSRTKVDKEKWDRMLRFGKSLRWKKVSSLEKEKELVSHKKLGNERKKRSGSGDAVKKA